jgi:hypothetical protein
MSSYFDLTPKQKRFWIKESHSKGRPALALIRPNGEVELDYTDEIIRKFEEVCGRKLREIIR